MANNLSPKVLSKFDSKIFNKDVEVCGVSINANNIEQGQLFIALTGAKNHGLDFLNTAIKNGAAAFLSER